LEGGFLDHWKSQVAEGKFRADKAQERVAKRLHRLQQALAGYSNENFFAKRTPPREKEDRETIKDHDETKPRNNGTHQNEKSDDSHEIDGMSVNNLVKPQIPRGLYIHGPVGSGKVRQENFFGVEFMLDLG